VDEEQNALPEPMVRAKIGRYSCLAEPCTQDSQLAIHAHLVVIQAAV
jgi:hypothetical protein